MKPVYPVNSLVSTRHSCALGGGAKCGYIHADDRQTDGRLHPSSSEVGTLKPSANAPMRYPEFLLRNSPHLGNMGEPPSPGVARVTPPRSPQTTHQAGAGRWVLQQLSLKTYAVVWFSCEACQGTGCVLVREQVLASGALFRQWPLLRQLTSI